MYDVIVVGAGAAGCSLALLLARRGYDILVLERDAVPRDAPQIDNLGPADVFLLERWGLAGELRATGCPPAARTTVWIGRVPMELDNPSEAPVTYAPRRGVLVSIASAAAMAAGAEMRRGFTAKDLVWDGEAVTGVVGHGPDGHSVFERARMVVGADGRSSLVARVVDADAYDEHPSTNCCYSAYWRGAVTSGPEVFLGERRAVALCPTDGALAWVVAARPVTDWSEFKRAPERMYLDQLADFPELVGRLAPAARESRLSGTADLGSSLRRPWGPGWALLGDAGQPCDSSICLATANVLVEAEMMARAIDEGFSGHRPLAGALAAYQRRRDARAMEARQVTRALGTYDWTLEEAVDIVNRSRAVRLRELEAVVAS